MDHFEKYISENREHFDDRNPDPIIWERIAARLPVVRTDRARIVLWQRVAAAAVVCALVMTGVVAGMYMGRGGLRTDPAYAEFLQTQHYYAAEYQKKKSEFVQYAYDPEVEKDLQELDRMYEELSRELSTAGQPNRSELISAMIGMYKTRIEMLERVMQKMEQGKKDHPTLGEDENIRI